MFAAMMLARIVLVGATSLVWAVQDSGPGNLCPSGSASGPTEDGLCNDEAAASAVLLLQTKKQLQMDQLQTQMKDQEPNFDCAMLPKMCEAPFKCDEVNVTEQQNTFLREGIAVHGPNAQVFCNSLERSEYAYQCLVTKDLAKAGQGRFDADAAMDDELTASMCFIEGHCLNFAVDGSTTVEEASQMCDERFGHERWSKIGSRSSSDVPAIPTDRKNFISREETTPWVIAACASGSYQCDVTMCRRTYCKHHPLVEKYGHFLEDFGWYESTEPWMKTPGAYRKPASA